MAEFSDILLDCRTIRKYSSEFINERQIDKEHKKYHKDSSSFLNTNYSDLLPY